jgi:hypothetical protein
MTRWGMAAALAAAACVLAGCAELDNDDGDTRSLGDFRAGVTTEQAARNELGPPSSVNARGDGQYELKWVDYLNPLLPGGYTNITLLFGADHRLVRIAEAKHR